jgi:hypothetical protein
MKRVGLVMTMAARLWAQDPPQAANLAPAQAASAPQAASPVPKPSEPVWSGYVDLGYQWRSDVGGSLATYRSIVNLGSGPKLIGSDLTVVDPKHRAFDQIRVRAYNWGDQPYQTFHLDAAKSKIYDFSADYRDFAYFNFLPSYADPLLARGIVLDEQSFDTRRRIGSFQLDLLPGNWIIPYFAYDRDSGSGHGATAFVTDANQFPVPTTMSDLTNLYRGGVRFERRKFHVTLEQGGTTFSNNQTLYQLPGSTNYGNVSRPILGQVTALTSLFAAYGIRGTSIYSKGLFTANPASWLDLYGQFLYSQPETDVNYNQFNNGNFLLLSQVLFYTGQQYLVSAAAKLPHTTGSFGAEIRPMRRMRIMESWLTDRLHNAGNAFSLNTISGVNVSEQMTALLAASLVTNYNQEEIDLFYDVTSKLTVRGGYRYVWGDASDAILPPEGLAGPEQGKLRRNVGLGAVTFRPRQKFSVTAEAEGSESGGVYFRTSLYNYERVRAQGRYQATNSLSAWGDFTYLHNTNPTPGVEYKYHAVQETASLLWTPKGGKNWDFEGSYSRSAVYSDINYLNPGTLRPQPSLYRDNAHTVTALVNVNLPKYEGLTPKIVAGASVFLSSGSRPTQYYQPYGKIFFPVQKHVALFGEWAYYGYGETFYSYENFHAHLVTGGVRLTR